MSRNDIEKALRLCTGTTADKACPKSCPYIRRSGCIRQLLEDVSTMLEKERHDERR